MSEFHENQHFTMPVAVHVFLEKNDQVLLLRRHNTGYEDGSYSVIAGHVDGGEKVVDAAIREAQEEAGITLDAATTRVVGVMHRLSSDERIDFFVVADRWQGEIANMEPEKCDDLSWFPRTALPENVIPYIRAAIDASSADLWFQYFGWD